MPLSNHTQTNDFDNERRSRAQAHYWPDYHKTIGTELDETDTSSELVKFHLGTNCAIGSEEFNGIALHVKSKSKFANTHLSFLDQGCIAVECHYSEEDTICDWIYDSVAKLVHRISVDDKVIDRFNEWPQEEIFYDDKINLKHPRMDPRIVEDKWDLPKDLALSSFMVDQVFTEESILELQNITGCNIARTTNGLSFYLKASCKNSCKDAMDRLTVLAQYYTFASFEENDEHFLYAEETTHWSCEFIYWAKYDRSTMATIFLDPAAYNLGEEKSAYRRVFNKGATIRCIPYDVDRKSFIRVSGQKFTPCEQEAVAKASYRAFYNWEYKDKTPKFCATIDIAEAPEMGPITLEIGKTIPSTSDFRTSDHATTDWIAKLPTFSNGVSTKASASLVSPEPVPGPSDIHGAGTPYDVMLPLTTLPSSHQTDRDQQMTDNINTNDADTEAVIECLPNIPRSPELTTQDTSVNHPGSNSTASTDFFSCQENASLHDHSPAKIPLDSSHFAYENFEDFDRVQNEKAKEKIPGECNIRNMPHLLLDLDNSANSPLKVALSSNPITSTNGSGCNGIESSNNQTLDAKNEELASQATSRPLRKTDPNTDPFAGIWSAAYHETMRQKKPPPRGKQPSNKSGLTRDPNPQLQAKVNGKLVRLLIPMRFMPGRIRLIAKIGRFIFTKAEISGDGHSEEKNPADMKRILDQAHVGRKTPMFTPIVTTHGGEASYFGQMKSDSGSQMWNPNGRQAAYEFICRDRSSNGDRLSFVIEVNSANFSYRIYPEKPDANSLLIHCTKRLWDIKIEVSAAKDLESLYGSFAKALVDSLRVLPQRNSVPVLEFSVGTMSSKPGYDPHVRWVRIRNTAEYDWADSGKLAPVGQNDVNKTCLRVAEVYDLELRTSSDNVSVTSYTASLWSGNTRLGQAGKWYEASIQSGMIFRALEENKRFQLGGKATWSPESFEKSAAFDELLKAATDTVKNMDGVGRYGDNEQDTMIHPLPAGVRSGIKTQAQNTRPHDWG